MTLRNKRKRASKQSKTTPNKRKAARTKRKAASSKRKAAPSKRKNVTRQRKTPPPTPPVVVTFTVGTNPMFIRRKFELLVVACDPRHLYGVCDYRPPEKAVFKKLNNLTFHTSLLKVKRNPQSQYAVIFAPPTDVMDGSVYAFRNETVKTFGLAAANRMAENLVTVYQLQTKAKRPLSPAQFQKILIDELGTFDWWPYGRVHGRDYEITDTVTTPYFDHFSIPDLNDGLPWDFLNLQGKHNTIYVHGSSCFESILQCWQYANMLLDPANNLGVKLPTRRDAPIIILGAGASGILFAQRLRELNYTNVLILEVTDRSDGKVHTIVKHGPYPPTGLSQPTVCELGACYLSPAYDDFVTYLTNNNFLKGNVRIKLADGASDFRGIATKGQFRQYPGWNPFPPIPPVMAFGDYCIQKAKNEMGWPWDTSREKVELQIGIDLVGYAGLQTLSMGDTPPMPTQQPTNWDLFGTKTFHQYLNDSGMLSLVGPLQYGFSVQGYGSLNSVSTYYTFIWITPPVVEAMAEGETVVTAWSKGWGDVFEQMKVGMKIVYNATTTKITRAN